MTGCVARGSGTRCAIQTKQEMPGQDQGEIRSSKALHSLRFDEGCLWHVLRKGADNTI